MWTDIKRELIEAFSSPRIVDKEFDEKVSELYQMVNSIENLNRIYHNFQIHTSGNFNLQRSNENI